MPLASTKIQQIIQRRTGGVELTQYMHELADYCRVSVTSMYRILREPGRAKHENLARAAEYLRCDVQDFFTPKSPGDATDK
jgi:DNA-binding transcriptional LysR family regulator